MQLPCTFYLQPKYKQEAGAEIKAEEGNAWNLHKPGMSHLVSCPNYLLSTSQVPSSVHSHKDGAGNQTVPALVWLEIY